MTNSVITKLDTDGNFHELGSYSLEPKQALIAYYMQNEKKNFNTWDYPSDIEGVRERPSKTGYFYNKGEDVIFSTLQKENAILINSVNEVRWVAKLKEYTTFEFTTKEEVYIGDADYECGLFRLFINSDGTKDVMAASDDDYDVLDDVTGSFDLEAIATICQNSNAYDSTEEYIRHYHYRKTQGEDVDVPEPYTSQEKVAL